MVVMVGYYVVDGITSGCLLYGILGNWNLDLTAVEDFTDAYNQQMARLEGVLNGLG